MEMKFFPAPPERLVSLSTIVMAKNVEQMPKVVWCAKASHGKRYLRLRFWVPG
jgi:hypothetical protein